MHPIHPAFPSSPLSFFCFYSFLTSSPEWCPLIFLFFTWHIFSLFSSFFIFLLFSLFIHLFSKLFLSHLCPLSSPLLHPVPTPHQKPQWLWVAEAVPFLLQWRLRQDDDQHHRRGLCLPEWVLGLHWKACHYTTDWQVWCMTANTHTHTHAFIMTALLLFFQFMSQNSTR